MADVEKPQGQHEKSPVALREEQTLSFWKQEKIFEKTLTQKSPEGEFVFYDGPPFANGLPHYGHILASVIKDVIPRYKTMRGFHVPRRWGWDCHGLPVENLVEKELGLKAKLDIENYGIERFNEAARKSVMQFADEWRRQIPRIGRWVDMQNDYRTMDSTYTESIWWAFKELSKKNLVYEGFKAMHLCPRCETTLSNFEVTQGYKEVTDISVYVKFPIVDETNTYFVAWTTTPWTLPGNAALAINPKIIYAKVKLTKNITPGSERTPAPTGFYIIAEERLAASLKGFEYEVVGTISGKDLVGKNYLPPFDYYFKSSINNRDNGWKVYAADFVTTEDGTGIVHIAPGFGEDDLTLGNTYHLPFIQHVGINGRFKQEVRDMPMRSVKPKENPQEMDIEIIRNLATKNLLFAKEKITHPYPHCWRCDTPLLNYAASSWFVKVSSFRDKLVEANKKIEWIPGDIRDGRFGKWLEGARDWAISRSRFWGAPLPVWRCHECHKSEFIGSLDELKTHTKSRNRFLIVRHGEAENNVRGILSGKAEVPHHLTERGKKQVEATAHKLKKYAIDAVYASPFVRTRETAEIIRTELNLSPQLVNYDERLHELNTGKFDGGPVVNFQKFFASDEERFTKTPEGGENYTDVTRRVLSFMYDIDRRFEGKTVLIVTHDSPGWMLAAAAEGLSREETLKLRGTSDYFITNAEIRECHFYHFPHNAKFEIDFHRPYVDEVTFTCSCGGVMRRVPDVFDCWFESGSMSFASQHYPFKKDSHFNPEGGFLKKTRGFPADFIAEGLDQTRGWFYSMLVLSVALFGESAYKKVIVNGIILAEDGQKMSKKLKNYPDPIHLIDRYGADALRYYLLSSPVVRGEDLRFSERAVQEVLSKVFNRLDNVLSFYKLYTTPESKNTKSKSPHVLDEWVLLLLDEAAARITEGLEAGELDRATRPLGEFVEDLSTWFLRRSRDRFKDGGEDSVQALATTRHVLHTLAHLLAPTAPFFAEYLFGAVKTVDEHVSIHQKSWPSVGSYNPKKRAKLLLEMEEVRSLVSLALEARAKSGIKVRQPLGKLTIKSVALKGKESLLELIKDEVNVKEIAFDEKLTQAVELDTIITPALKEEGNARDFIRAVQELRKEAGLEPGTLVTLQVETDDLGKAFLERNKTEISKVASLKTFEFSTVSTEPLSIDSFSFKLQIKK